MAGRVWIGFSGGQVVEVKLAEPKLKELRKLLEQADGWADLETEDGTVALDLSQVVFVRGAAVDQRIGFSG